MANAVLLSRIKSASLSTLLTLSVFAPSFALADGSQCAAIFKRNTKTVSNELLWLEKDSPERLSWIRDQSAKLNVLLKESPNFKAVSNFVRKRYSGSIDLETIELNSNESIEMVFRGFDQGRAVVLKKKNGEEIDLLTTRSFRANLSEMISDISISPNKENLLVTVAKNGTLDRFKNFIYHLPSRKLLDVSFISRNETFYWLSDHEILFNSFNPEIHSSVAKAIDLRTGQIEDYSSIKTLTSEENSWAVATTNSGSEVLLSRSGKFVVIHDASPDSVIGESGGELFFLASGGNVVSIRAISLAEKYPPSRALISVNDKALSEVKLFGKHIVFIEELAADRRVIVSDLQGKRIASVKIPEFASTEVKDFDLTAQILTLKLNSAVAPQKEFRFNLRLNKFERDLRAELLTVDGVEFESRVIYPKADDGVEIPTLLTYRKGRPFDGSLGALMQVYGGFGSNGYLEPRYNRLTRRFIEDGGVLVGPAVRGGKEFGFEWQSSANFGQKTRTFDDIAAVAKNLIENKISSAEKLVLTGTSNGGMVSAATGLRHPELFGLIIPENGVHDMLGKERLDRRFYEGWSYEYGDSRSELRKYIASYSPVEAAVSVQTSPEFLIINGSMDSRVASAHSFKLHAALSENPAVTSNLLSLKNSGHHVNSIGTGLISWRAASIFWSRIYDKTGLKMNP